MQPHVVCVWLAQGLVRLLIPEFRNDLYGPIADRLDEHLRERGLSVVIGSSGWSPEGDLQVLESFMAQRLEGECPRIG